MSWVELSQTLGETRRSQGNSTSMKSAKALTLTKLTAKLSVVALVASFGFNVNCPASCAGQIAPSVKQATPAEIKQWFVSYDQIRRQAQLTPNERQEADNLISKGLSVLMPGEEKIVAQALLTKLVNKYTQAVTAMGGLPLYAQTLPVHRGYFQYFTSAGQLFSDYLKVQNDLFVVDQATGQPLLSQLMQRKQQLADLDTQIKQVDKQVRAQFGVQAYQY